MNPNLFSKQTLFQLCCAVALVTAGCQNVSNSTQASVGSALAASRVATTTSVPTSEFIERESNNSSAQAYIDTFQKLLTRSNLMVSSSGGDTMTNAICFFLHRSDIDSLIKINDRERADGIVIRFGYVKPDVSDPWNNKHKGELRPYLRPVQWDEDSALQEMEVPYYYINKGCPTTCTKIKQ